MLYQAISTLIINIQYRMVHVRTSNNAVVETGHWDQEFPGLLWHNEDQPKNRYYIDKHHLDHLDIMNQQVKPSSKYYYERQ